MFGGLFRVSEKRLLVGQVVLHGRAARQRAGDRPQRRGTAVQPDERLGRRAGDLQIAEIEEEHVRRRVQQAQRTVHLERGDVRLAAEQHRQHDLVDVARGDVLLAGVHALGEFLLRQARLRGRDRHLVTVSRHRASQLADDLGAQRLALVFGTIVQQRDAPCDVIKDEQRLRRHERGIGDARLLFRVDRQLLEQAHDIVTRDADETARKRQVIRRLRHRGFGKRFPQRIEVFALVGRSRPFLTRYGERDAVHANLERFTETEERVARQALAPLDGLEQESRLERAEFQVGGYRGIEIRRYVEWGLHIDSIKRRSRTSMCFAA